VADPAEEPQGDPGKAKHLGCIGQLHVRSKAQADVAELHYAMAGYYIQH